MTNIDFILHNMMCVQISQRAPLLIESGSGTNCWNLNVIVLIINTSSVQKLLWYYIL